MSGRSGWRRRARPRRAETGGRERTRYAGKRRRSHGPLGAVPDPHEHLALHRQRCSLDERPRQPIEPGAAGSTPASGEEARRAVAVGLHHEGPGFIDRHPHIGVGVGGRPGRRIAREQHEGVPGFDRRDEEGGLVALAERDDVADGERLELRHDRVDRPDVAANEVLQPVVAVEAAAALAQLEQPRPDRLGRRCDRDAARVPDLRIGNKLVAGEWPIRVVRPGAPRPRGGREPASPGDGQRDGGAEKRDGNEADAHVTTSARQRHPARARPKEPSRPLPRAGQQVRGGSPPRLGRVGAGGGRPSGLTR